MVEGEVQADDKCDILVGGGHVKQILHCRRGAHRAPSHDHQLLGEQMLVLGVFGLGGVRVMSRIQVQAEITNTKILFWRKIQSK